MTFVAFFPPWPSAERANCWSSSQSDVQKHVEEKWHRNGLVDVGMQHCTDIYFLAARMQHCTDIYFLAARMQHCTDIYFLAARMQHCTDIYFLAARMQHCTDIYFLAAIHTTVLATWHCRRARAYECLWRYVGGVCLRINCADAAQCYADRASSQNGLSSFHPSPYHKCSRE